MSPLAQKILEKLAKEQDLQLLAEVLDFYEYVKEKRQKQQNKTWENIEEDEPTKEEKNVLDQYNAAKHDFTDFHLLVRELRSDD